MREYSKMNDRYQMTVPRHSKNTKQAKCHPTQSTPTPQAYYIQAAENQRQRKL